MRVPDFPLGALFGMIVMGFAILFTFPDISNHWLRIEGLIFGGAICVLGTGILASMQPSEHENDAMDGSGAAAATSSWQWLVFSLVRGRRVIELIGRPESMTAYATLAAALAAFLTWKTAERQEKATFTSNLYNKQVETVASYTQNYSEWIVNVSNFYDKSGDDRWKFYDSIQASRLSLVNSMANIEVLYPKETESFMNELGSAETRVWFSLGDAPPGPMSEDRKKDFEQFNQLVGKLLLCSREQLREGSNLDGGRFSDCVRDEK